MIQEKKEVLENFLQWYDEANNALIAEYEYTIAKVMCDVVLVEKETNSISTYLIGIERLEDVFSNAQVLTSYANNSWVMIPKGLQGRLPEVKDLLQGIGIILVGASGYDIEQEPTYHEEIVLTKGVKQLLLESKEYE